MSFLQKLAIKANKKEEELRRQRNKNVVDRLKKPKEQNNSIPFISRDEVLREMRESQELQKKPKTLEEKGIIHALLEWEWIIKRKRP